MATVQRRKPPPPPQTTISPTLPTVLFTLLILVTGVTTEPTEDKNSLITFISTIPHSPRINWNTSSSVCSWTGVTCDVTNSSVIYLRLPGAGLLGNIPYNTIGKLTNLRVLSLRSNKLTGQIPTDFRNLIALRSVYLQNNLLSGGFPPSFTGLTSLTRLDLSRNNFSGSIPFSINNLTQLAGIYLQNNNFSGELPNISQQSLTDIKISNNTFNGSIPTSLSKFPATSFAGNINLCGKPLPPCNESFLSPAPSPISPPAIVLPPPVKKNSKKLSTGAIIAIVIGSALILALILLLLLLRIRRRRNQQDKLKQSPKPQVPAAVAGISAVNGVTETGTSSSKDELTARPITGEKNKLIFLTAGIYSFDLDDLLRASAEVLGKGSVGTSYKAVLEDGTTVVVKRLKEVTVTKKEFEMRMEVLAKIDNENVIPLRAFYYSKDEKLIVSDFLPNASLSTLLHGSRGTDRTPLDWDHRVKIAICVAKSVAYLHVLMNVVHGNIKSSNVLLREATNTEAAVSDYGLNQLFNGPGTPNIRVSGYWAPEVLENRKVSFKSDVYSYGVLLLELLTGKSPNQASSGEEGIDLPRWVQSVVREEWTAEVFDVELMMGANIEEEIVQLLQIAMACVSTVPDQRPAMQEVVKMIEEMNRAESDDGLRQSSDDPSKGSGGHTPPTETRNSPQNLTP